ncbi:MAG TPA: hypothetical protein VHS31_04270 [Tepidisphaeraceae bacterium]|jgi:hypothetical protein|nr:hypothetical protein [Tepidisphaeraceae bacterium]
MNGSILSWCERQRCRCARGSETASPPCAAGALRSAALGAQRTDIEKSSPGKKFWPGKIGVKHLEYNRMLRAAGVFCATPP